MQSGKHRRRILFLAANPETTARLRIDREQRDIEEGLKRARHRDELELICRWAVTARDVSRALLDTRPEIVHISAHGEGGGGLLLEDGSGQEKSVSSEALGRLFALANDTVKCVVINACRSVEQASIICDDVDCVIGMETAIGDSAAAAFSIGFYDAIGAGKSYEAAFEWGCNAISLEGRSGAIVPKLYRRPHITPTPASSTSSAFLRPDRPSPPFVYDAFFSYRHIAPDREFARHLLHELQYAGFKVAIGERDYTPGLPVIFEMERCVRESRYTLALISPRYLTSGYNEEESIISKTIGLEERGRRLIPVVVEHTDLPFWMAGLNKIDFSEPDPLVPPMQRLLQMLGTPSGPPDQSTR